MCRFRKGPYGCNHARGCLIDTSSILALLTWTQIDGVICCNMAGRLEESKLSVLNSVCKATDAKVVLSTDWRRQAQLKRQVVGALKRLDIEVIGATPMRAMFQPIRPQEILEWLSANGPKFDVTSWVAIDDRDLLNEHGGAGLQGHMVRTHPSTGLTKRLGDVAIEVRNSARVRFACAYVPIPGPCALFVVSCPARRPAMPSRPHF